MANAALVWRETKRGTIASNENWVRGEAGNRAGVGGRLLRSKRNSSGRWSRLVVTVGQGVHMAWHEVQAG